MKRILFLIGFWPLLLNAQKDNQTDSVQKGIQFEREGGWQQIVKKAKKTGKFIFVDCFTTWCGPCKEMEKEVYGKPEVGSYFNGHFISVKLQMDQTPIDEEQVRARYNLADYIQKKYGVPAYPSYLFFSPDGQLIDRGLGYKSADVFIADATRSIDPKMGHPFVRYYRMLNSYQKGKRDYTNMLDFLDTAKMLGQDDVVVDVSKDYLVYLCNQDSNVLYTKRNLAFLAAHTDSSKSPFFKLFYPGFEKANSIMKKNGYAESVVGKIILKEDIIPSVLFITGMQSSGSHPKEENDPDWQILEENISIKYTSALADENILKAKMKWCFDHHQWADCAKWLTRLVDKYTMDANGEGQDLELNSICWEAVFKRSVDKEQISAAIKCMKEVLQRSKELYGESPYLYVDTYANLLFKSGDVDRAIQQEQGALNICIKNKLPEEYLTDLRNTLKSMKAGTPTWPRCIDKEDVFGMGLI